MRLKDNPQGCSNPDKRGNRTCIECYYEQVKDGQWHGGERCWEAQCLVADTGKGKTVQTDRCYQQKRLETFDD